MQIHISNANGQPIYEQIYTQIKTAIISGQLPEGTMLPSIRNLAKDLRISVITTKRAYDELEMEQFISATPGKGFYVLHRNHNLIVEDQLRQIESHLEEVITLAKPCGITLDQMQSMLTNLYQDHQEQSTPPASER